MFALPDSTDRYRARPASHKDRRRPAEHEWQKAPRQWPSKRPGGGLSRTEVTYRNTSSRGSLRIKAASDVQMLELRPNCECCNRDLPPESMEARICSFECTFCVDCAETALGGLCPNCGGELVSRPRRPNAELVNHPASTRRVYKPNGCGDRT